MAQKCDILSNDFSQRRVKTNLLAVSVLNPIWSSLRSGAGEKFTELNFDPCARVSIQLLRYGRHPRAGANEMTRWNNKAAAADRSNSATAARTHIRTLKFQRRRRVGRAGRRIMCVFVCALAV